MISGMYMGELIRQVLLDLMKDDLIFFNCNREKLLERGSFYTRFASEIESDPVGDYTRARMALQELEIDPGLYFSFSGSAIKKSYQKINCFWYIAFLALFNLEHSWGGSEPRSQI